MEHVPSAVPAWPGASYAGACLFLPPSRPPIAPVAVELSVPNAITNAGTSPSPYETMTCPPGLSQFL